MLDDLTTESHNPKSAALDSMSALQIVQLMNAEDAGVAAAVAEEATAIAQAIDFIADRFRHGGRLVYIGAGTSGRLGVLDASECPPTFSAPPGMVIGLIAGGNEALTRSIEGAEDYAEHGRRDLMQIDLSEKDVTMGIATSGCTPYVIGGLQYANSVGAFTIGLSCNQDSDLQAVVQLMIAPVVGPEVISGSTRLKAGTATKMVLNLLTTGAMVRLGKTYGNLMVDLTATNNKLKSRSRRIVAQITGLDADAAASLVDAVDGEVKTAIVCHQRGITPDQARRRLSNVDGHLRRALEE